MSTTKMIPRRLGLSLAFALALGLATAGDASAHGLVIDASELTPAARTSLANDVQRARTEIPELFRQVADVAKRANAIDGASRLPGAPFTMHFKALGPRALLPMLDMLTWGTSVPADLTPTAKSALRVGLVEAVGIVRDARAVPVLSRIAAKESSDTELTRASADALGRIGTDDAFTALTTALSLAEPQGGERYHALLAGVGSARRLEGVRLLARKLDAKPDEATARAIAKSLSVAGNAWAWKTLTVRTDELAVREAAARALVRIYVTYTAEARKAAGGALLVVDDAHTASLIAEARKTASGDAVQALDELSARVAKNPTR